MSEWPRPMDREQTLEQVPIWGDPISPERQDELWQCLDQWEEETDHGERQGPFDKGPFDKGPFDRGPGKMNMRLTGADVYWIVGKSRDILGFGPELHFEHA